MDNLNLDQEDPEATKYRDLATLSDGLVSIPELTFFKDPEVGEILFATEGFTIPNRGLYLIRGANGTGKSMFLGMLSGQVGSKFYQGSLSITKNQDRIIMLTYPHIFVNGSYKENLFGTSRDARLEEMLGIDFKDKEITTNPINLSLGQCQKMTLLRVLSEDMDYIFLDEPLTNLDRDVQQRLVRYVEELKQHKCVIVITHDHSFNAIADGAFEISQNRLIPVPVE